ANEVLQMLGIEELRELSFSELSGGQRQKVLLARALMATKKILILDEPSNNLDQKSKRELYDIIRELNVKQKIAVIMVTHDLDHDNLIGNKILSPGGDDYFFGTTEDYVRRVHHE
ncbi:MAG: ABC transporter ATP-binding protein, partial [Candidatus Saccharibacteria bacterium]|nr:ABC transporter ATP-binding protein [Candidatus Saccharibacteria bacterium]